MRNCLLSGRLVAQYVAMVTQIWNKPFFKVIKKNNILVSKTALVRNNMPPLKRAFQIFDLCNDKNWKSKRGTTNF